MARRRCSLLTASNRHAENGRGGGGMNILPGAESCQHGLIVRHMRHDAQLDLGIIHREQEIALIGDECLAHLAANFGADGDILQIRVGGGDAAR